MNKSVIPADGRFAELRYFKGPYIANLGYDKARQRCPGGWQGRSDYPTLQGI